MAEPKLPASGGCLCGALRYEVSAPPIRVTFCHCRFCQRLTGSQGLVEPVFDSAAFRVTAGEPRVHDHRSEGSGKVIHVRFCGACGAHTHMTFERFPDVTGVFGGTFDDPDWFDREDPARTKVIFAGVAMRGTLIPAHLPVYDEHATDREGRPRTPRIHDAPRRVGG